MFSLQVFLHRIAKAHRALFSLLTNLITSPTPMDHAILLNVDEANARYVAFQHQFPERRLPAQVLFDSAQSAGENLDKLALFALHHEVTLAVLYAYQPIFLDIVARWIERPAEFELAYCQLHSLPHQNLTGSIVLSALSRVCQLLPGISELLESYLLEGAFLEGLSPLTTTPRELQMLLLSFYRIYSDKPHQFAAFIIPEVLYLIIQLPHDYEISKYLAVKILSIYLNVSESARLEMSHTHLKESSLYGEYDGGYSIDYSLLDLVEAKRLSNFTALPTFVATQTNATYRIESSDLSSRMTSVCGILIAKISARTSLEVSQDEAAVPTKNSVRVLRTMAQMIQQKKPVMLHGKAGSGKTFLINLLAKYLSCQGDIVKVHLGEQTDAKLLLGTFISGEKPGSFEWRSGVLTTAVKEGKWILVEDIDKAPTEVLSILLTLLEKRELSIPSRGEVIKAHSNFQLISTIRTQQESKIPDMIGLRLWELVHVEEPTEMELRVILLTMFPVLKNLIAKFVTLYNNVLQIYSMTSFISLNRGSHPRVISTRDLMKFCSRCERMLSNRGITSADQLLESLMYENIFAEAVECFGSAITEYGALVPLVSAIGEILEMPTSRINLFLDSYVPSFYNDDEKIEIGRSVLKKVATDKALYVKKKSGNHTNFARTKHSKRLMEQIGVAVEMTEPVLLVGETGTGKTTVVQEIAKMMNKKLTVINVSQQTESGDLLGGYKPVNTKTVAIPLQEVFENLFLVTFSLKKNAKFSALLSKCFNRNQWKNVVKLWKEAIKMAEEILTKTEDSDEDQFEEGGRKKRRKLRSNEKSVLVEKWTEFRSGVENFETQAINLESSFVFNFVEGSLVKAVKNGEWLLLDEINLASPDTLESISDLLSESLSQRSILLGERGDVDAIVAHPEFKIFGCMNPSTDVGKKDLPLSIRSRFTEIYVHSPDRDKEDLLFIIQKYIERYAVGDDWVVEDIAELYTKAKDLANSNKIVDGANQKPHFSIRTLTRTLVYVRDIVSVYGLRRSLYEGFCMAFLTLLDQKSEEILRPIIEEYTINKLKNAKAIVGRCPPPPSSNEDAFVQFKHYWMKRGPGDISSPNYIITPFVEKNLLNLVRATASRKFPVLVQGPTSAGKTSMINYLAGITGHKFVRINNHEHTDLQEYLGTYISDSSGKMVFKEGVLVEALRKGHWIVLDELNLAPTDVLEALNRLLDDNRELFIPETQEVVHPHPDFMLFATQNPPGLYGGRKVLSRAFRNRFLELHFDDIPQDELEVILRERCKIAPSYAKKIVEVYKQLSVRRQSTRLFEQKNSFATLRDLFRWAMREAVGYEQLAANGYMLLAERVRSNEEKSIVKEAIEGVMRVKLDMDAYYESLENSELFKLNLSIVWTKAMRRLAVLVETSIKYNEPLLLVGETGCGKTTVCQILADLHGRQLITVNAHQNTETGDILGAQRPLRNRFELTAEALKLLTEFFNRCNIEIPLEQSTMEFMAKKYNQVKKKMLEDEKIPIDIDFITLIEEKLASSSVLFEWVDGPLIQAMKLGDFFLLDEISLADDSVLERLNSVLEPERSLLLAEKGTQDAFLTAQGTFQFLATMNPGGDYGKKELSPALRNRFTEIWVPSMDDFSDVEQIVKSRLVSSFAALCTPLVNFSEWFGKKLGKGHANSGVISLRDILAWVEFLNSCEQSMDGPTALMNGASMVFIDALGTNNTAHLAESEEGLMEFKRECVCKLEELLGNGPKFPEYFKTLPYDIEVGESLKVGNFSIPRLCNIENNISFSLQAPTTSANAMRVLRAMQVNKPVLLEGSPGVGKTSLIAAIAKLTGNNLIRINLSEQTDLIDLFGSDAPVEGGQTGEFMWRDAAFLRAMKNGEWVLLDEMNLASQSVLEGLNACLDHRGEAYIPELDRSFPRHPDFKVFAAQNPQYQGGGRKGLPKSFVNRFSVVYMDVLKTEDLTLISRQLFPHILNEDCAKLIQFMGSLEEEIVVQKKWGMLGGPWEFNLRDTLRWLSLYCSKHNLSAESDRSLGDFLQMIICQRFRSSEDSKKAETLFESIFGPQRRKDFHFGINPDCVQAGGSIIQRNTLLHYKNSADRMNYIPLQCNFPILESAVRCVNENIPMILTGPTNSGKTEFVRYFANLVGVQLREFAMNSDVDSMDILGGYEQVDLTRAINKLTSSVLRALNELAVVNLKTSCSDSSVLSKCLLFVHYMETNIIAIETFPNFINYFREFLDLYANEELTQLFSACSALNHKLKQSSKVKFEWFDGLLVLAVSRGDWLVLDNANLCNPSVLDRLNSLLETNGSLMINECSESDGSPRLLKPHPNFRLFLTVDPKYGELSRAMRNRCIEVFVDSLEQRATSFDAICLGSHEKKARASNVEEMVESLEISDSMSNARPIATFSSMSDSIVRSFATVQDCLFLSEPIILTGALLSILLISSTSLLGAWTKTVKTPEFSTGEVIIIEEVVSVIKYLERQGYIRIIKSLYERVGENQIVPSNFENYQPTHTFMNVTLLGYLTVERDPSSLGSTMLLQVAAGIIKAKSTLSYLERRASNARVTDLSFLEKSAAVHLGRELKKPPKVNIYGFIKAIADFISAVFEKGIGSIDYFSTESQIFASLSELQCLWDCLFAASKEQNVSKLRIYHSAISTWLLDNETSDLVKEHSQIINQVKVGLELTSGFSMRKIWEYFRGTYPQSTHGWNDYAQLVELLNEFDSLSRKLYPDAHGEVTILRKQLVELHGEITNERGAKSSEFSGDFDHLSLAIKGLREIADTFTVSRNNEFEDEFTALSNFLEVSSYFTDPCTEKQIVLANYSAISTLNLIANSSEEVFLPYPRVFDSLWTCGSGAESLFTNNILCSTLTKSIQVDRYPGKYLDQNLADMSTLTGHLIEHSTSILVDEMKNFKKVLYKWLIGILEAHQFELPVDLQDNISTQEDVIRLLDAVKCQADAFVAKIMEEFFVPTLYIIVASSNPSELGKAWILFSAGCIQLFVPNSPLDPAIEEHVAGLILQAQQKMSLELLASWKIVRTTSSGDRPIKIEMDLPEPNDEGFVKPHVFREDEGVDDLFEEWDAFMKSSIDLEPINKLLEAAEQLALKSNSDIVGIFHNNSANFMLRLSSKFLQYADLNDILNGYIYGIRLGLNLMSLGNRNATADFRVKSLWALDIPTLLQPNDVAETFQAVREVSKQLGTDSVLSEKLMHFFITLCFAQKQTLNPKLESVLDQAFQSIYYRWYYRRVKDEKNEAEKGSLYKHKDTDDDNADFKELFPDYDEVMDFNSENSGATSSESFEHIYHMFVELYVNYYLNINEVPLKNIVEQGARLCVDLQDQRSDLLTDVNRPSHLSALMLAIQSSYELYTKESDGEINFYHEPNPAEYRQAMKIVLSIHTSVAKLLAQWPEHATLQSIQRSTDEFLSYPSSFPLDKLLHKIEKIFNFMNEWEKFASSLVTLKSHYNEVTKLIVSWRKLELVSWKSIFTFEEAKLKQNLGKWWFHLYESIIVPYTQYLENGQLPGQEPSIVQILGALNIFMSETTYGEFGSRLELIKAFRNHALAVFSVEKEVSNALSNFITFYEQFQPQIVENVNQTKKVLTKEVSEIILLASWKDVNIDALKQSSRRSHNNLFKIVRKYRALLSTPVSPMIQAGLSKESAVSHGIFEPSKLSPPIEATNEHKLKILRLCSSVQTWEERPNRLRNIDMLEKNLMIYVKRINSYTSPSIYDYAKEVVEEMERLKKETPSVMNDETKKTVSALKSQKHKLLSSTLKELRRIGVRTTVKPDIRKVLATVNLVLANCEAFDGTTLFGCDGHFFRCLEMLPRLRSSIASGNDDIPQPDLEKGLAASENMMFSMVSTRKPLRDLATSVQHFEKLHTQITGVADIESHQNRSSLKASTIESVKFNINQIRIHSSNMIKILEYAIEVCGSAAKFSRPANTNIFIEFTSAFSNINALIDATDAQFFTAQDVDLIGEFSGLVNDLQSKLIDWQRAHPQVAFIADVVLTWIERWSYNPFLNSSTSLQTLAVLEDVELILRKLSNSILVSVQKVLELLTDVITEEDDEWFLLSQQRIMKIIQSCHHNLIASLANQALTATFQIEQNTETWAVTSALFQFTLPLIREYHNLLSSVLSKAKQNYEEFSKTAFILMKSLNTLATEGYCSPDAPSEQKQDDNLHDGTGLGDGEGATNNSKDVEEDDDLTEHAQQPNEDKDKDENDPEDDDAVDMEGDMAGDLEELSDQEKLDEENDDEGDNDMDEQVDDIDDLDPNAIDEKMWDEEANENDKEKDSEKMPQNSVNDDDNMEAMEQEDEAQDKNDTENKEENQGEEDGESEEEEDVGEQEDEVRNEDNEQLEDHVPETETLDLPEDMNLDDDEEDKDEGEEEADLDIPDDKMDIDRNADENEEQNDEQNDEQEAEEEDISNAGDDDLEDEQEDELEDAEDNLETEGEVNEDPGDNCSDEESVKPADEEEAEKDEEKQDSAEQGEDSAEGAEGADNMENQEDVDMDSATKTEAGEQGDGADNQVVDEKEDIGASGGASSDRKQDEEQQENEEQAPVEDGARDEMKEQLKQLGDSLKEFHRRRQEIKEASIEDKEETEKKSDVKPDEFQHVDTDNADHDTQALGAVDNKDQVQSIDEDMAIDESDHEEEQDANETPANIKEEDSMDIDENVEEAPEKAESDADDYDSKMKGGVVGERKFNEEQSDSMFQNEEVELKLEEDESIEQAASDDFLIKINDTPAMSLEHARELWNHSEVSTQELAAGLCEQLRLILEPTLATKLRGDYKTGKRLNMKRIIPYIASEFRKDKIWLRRTKPAKRQYQIMIAVDDSKSMSESKSTELAFHSIALVSKALTQLESGGLSVVRFGEDVKLVHPFDKPFNQEAGANVFQWFDFMQERTDIKQLCSKSLKIFENARSTSNSDLWQLQIILSDGVCEDHQTVQRLVRKAREERVMLVFVIIDGISSNESILDMSQVSYVPDPITGSMTLKVENYLDTFPFEFYVVVRNINELPEMLSLILRQYFSEVASI